MPMNKALFLDRDGVINQERGVYTYKIEDFRLTSGIIPFLREALKKGYLLIVITNQGGIAQGLYTEKDLEIVHQYMKKLLADEQIILTDIYYCPHHPSVSSCQCRKPGTLMLEQAMEKYHVNPSESLFVGDSLRDAEAGKRMGIPVLHIEPNEDLTRYLGSL